MKTSSSSSIPRSVSSALLIFVGIFLILEYSSISLIFANISHNMDWYFGKDRNIKQYNEALFLAETGDFTWAKSILFPLLNEKTIQNPSDVFELYGDLIYKTSLATGDILTSYKRSLSYGENLRVEQKITLIENPEQKTQSGSTNTGTMNKKNTETASGFASWGASREAKKQELKNLQENRKGAINFSAPMPGDIQQEVQGIFSVLGGGSEKKDW